MMKAAKSYSEKLKDPRWQKKRLKILERDQYMCKGCGSTRDELHIHHLRYVDNPWETEDQYLVTLCSTCHKHAHEIQEQNKRFLYNSLSDCGFTEGDIAEFGTLAKNIVNTDESGNISKVILYWFRNYKELEYICKARNIV